MGTTNVLLRKTQHVIIQETIIYDLTMETITSYQVDHMIAQAA
ncbi:hypothetical protein LINPERHAP1_LOCUS14477 [Linum perenne]